jgi:hypothetical protein
MGLKNYGLQKGRELKCQPAQRGARGAKSKVGEVPGNVVFFTCQVKQNAGSKYSAEPAFCAFRALK